MCPVMYHVPAWATHSACSLIVGVKVPRGYNVYSWIEKQR